MKFIEDQRFKGVKHVFFEDDVLDENVFVCDQPDFHGFIKLGHLLEGFFLGREVDLVALLHTLYIDRCLLRFNFFCFFVFFF